MKKVYLCFSTDIIHTGHINIISEAEKYGEVIVGVLADKYVAMFEKTPMISQKERMKIVKKIKGVSEVILQDSIYYDENLKKYQPDYVIHGDNWNEGYQREVKKRAIEIIKEWGGEVIEVPYYKNEGLNLFNTFMGANSGLAESRRQRLRYMIERGQLVKVLVAYDGMSALIVEKTRIENENSRRQFDGIWLSSLCDSTSKGKPDIEVVDLTSRINNLEDIMEVTTKPIIFDADTGGLTEHFVYNIRTLERVGASAVIIEDKIGLKRNSLLGNEVEQYQDSIENFCNKISEGKKAVISKNFMLIARIESLILEQGMEDALERAEAYVKAGADGIMIHSRKKEPDEIFEFVDKFREKDKETPIVVVPTTYNQVYEKELQEHGVNIVIYANQMLRAAFVAMENVAKTILQEERCKEVDESCLSIKEILSLIPV